MGTTAGALARYPSPLRYPGGKGKVSNFMKLLVLQNDLVGIDYVEPYAGGASVALSLLFEEFVDNIQINDLNEGVHAFWSVATTDPDYLKKRIAEVPLDVDEWIRQRAVYNDPDADTRTLAFATFFLNRTNRSGIIARGGVIGGLQQTGPWKLDARFDRRALIGRIDKVARFSDRIKVTRQDAAALLASRRRRKTSALLYLDPPYFVKGSGLYDNSYEESDHEIVQKAVTKLSGPWVVSYDAAPEILRMYKNSTSLSYTLGYSAATVGEGAEAMFFSPDLVVPRVASPAGVRSSTVAAAQMAELQERLWSD